MDHDHNPPWAEVMKALGVSTYKGARSSIATLCEAGLIRSENGRIILVLPTIREVSGGCREASPRDDAVAILARIRKLQAKRDRINDEIRRERETLATTFDPYPAFKLSTAPPAGRPTFSESAARPGRSGPVE